MIIELLVNAVAVFLAAYLLQGVEVKSFWSAILTAVVLAIVNAVIKPIMIFLTIPVTIITFGLFLLVINALMLMLVDAILPGLKIKNFWWALIFGIVLSIINAILSWIIL
ncbi:putative membrane protein [Catalinimonas alkaloidigena]|uniref:phage holin family protein n=1 Tax=Catalinimonas alkaloidigena TaxID=1075417 RepID=UPI00240585A1|nr:phage holin family protein [Catalinimonas alkaloidigena]MDF9796720.1 putative membrane protein [Catalinimonas alkaloidigena]